MNRYIRWVGLGVTALALGLVIWSLYTSDLLRSDAWTDPDVLYGVVVAALIYYPSLCIVFAAWYLLIMSVAKTHISWSDGFYIYAVSAIYRYIPSNIIHFVGRYYMLRQRGVEHSAASWGILAETALLGCASTLIALAFGAPLIRGRLVGLVQDNWLIFAVIAAVGVVALSIATLILRRRWTIRELLVPFAKARVFHAGIVAFLLYCFARTISGVSLWWLSAGILGVDQFSLATMIAIWAAAWTLGYVTPGAAAGIGIREAAIIAALANLDVPVGDATLVAIAFRVSTTISDLLFSTSGWLMNRLAQHTQPSNYPS